jgi:hypothetical protein
LSMPFAATKPPAKATDRLLTKGGNPCQTRQISTAEQVLSAMGNTIAKVESALHCFLFLLVCACSQNGLDGFRMAVPGRADRLGDK